VRHGVTVVTEARFVGVGWVVLVYRVPRVPSSPRIAVWRRLRRLGVAQLGDGVVALPEDARTREHLEWVAEQVVEAGGTALLLRAETFTARDERSVAESMAAARAGEYRAVTSEAAAALDSPGDAQVRTLRRLRRTLREIKRRDFFPPSERMDADAAVRDLAAAIQGTDGHARPERQL
jgi:hypothetical protein